MTVHYYTDSSQMALRFDRVGHADYGTGELGMLWLNPATEVVGAEVAWESGPTTSVPLRSLIYIPPERELAESIMADAESGPSHTWVIPNPDPFEVRSEALRAAVAALEPLAPLMHANPAGVVAGRAGHIVAMANTFIQFLTQPGPDEAGADPLQA